MDGLEAEYRALDPVGSGAISRVVLRDRYQGLGPDAGTKKLVEAAGAQRLVIFHHDPAHDDATMDIIAEEAAAARPGTIVAREGMLLSLT